MPLNIFLDFLYFFLFFLQFGPATKGGNTVSKASDLLDLNNKKIAKNKKKNDKRKAANALMAQLKAGQLCKQHLG